MHETSCILIFMFHSVINVNVHGKSRTKESTNEMQLRQRHQHDVCYVMWVNHHMLCDIMLAPPGRICQQQLQGQDTHLVETLKYAPCVYSHSRLFPSLVYNHTQKNNEPTGFWSWSLMASYSLNMVWFTLTSRSGLTRHVVLRYTAATFQPHDVFNSGHFNLC